MADNIASAVVLSGASGSVDGDNTGYTLETGEAALLYDTAGSFGYGGGRSAWHKFTAPAAGDYTFYTTYTDDTYVNSGLGDSIISVLDGTNFATATVLGFNDDGPAALNLWSLITLTLTSGQIIYINVDGYNGNATDAVGYNITDTRVGVFRLHWGAPPSIPGSPVVVTGIADGNIGLHGTVNSRGVLTDWRFQYGTTVGYGSLTPNRTLDSPDYAVHNVVETINPIGLGLSSFTTYHFRLYATNTLGTVVGSDATFTTGNLDPPDIRNVTIINVTASTVTADFEINPMGLIASYWTEVYNVTLGGIISSPHTLDGSGTGWVAVESIATGLTQNTKYRVRGRVQTVNGSIYTAYSAIFTTGLGPVFAQCPPNLTDPFTGAECTIPAGWNTDNMRIFSNAIGAYQITVENVIYRTNDALSAATGELSADVWVQLKVVDGRQDVGTGPYSARSDAAMGQIQIIRNDGATETILAQTAQSFSDGDWLGFRYDNSTHTISAYHRTIATGWATPLLSIIDTTYLPISQDMPFLLRQSTIAGPPAISPSNLFDLSTYGVTPAPISSGCPAGTDKYVWGTAVWSGPYSGSTTGVAALTCPVWWLDLTVFPHGRLDCSNTAWSLGDAPYSIDYTGDFGTSYKALPFYPQTPDDNAMFDDLDTRFGGFYVYDSDFAYKCYAAIQSSLNTVQTAFASDGAYTSTNTSAGKTARGVFMPIKKSIGRMDNFSMTYEHCAPTIIPIVSFSSIRQEELRTVN